MRDRPACKTKWNQCIPDYKSIAYYLCCTGRNIHDYWEFTTADRKAKGLLRQFSQEVFDAIHEWYGNRPHIQLPHVRDLLATNEVNYRMPQHAQQHNADDGDNEPETKDHWTYHSRNQLTQQMTHYNPGHTAGPPPH